MGILASPTTIRSKLYENAMKRNGIEVVAPSQDEMAIIEECIRGVIEGKTPKVMRPKLRPIIERFVSSGCEVVLLGCTELSVIFSGSNDRLLVDPMDIITKELVK